MRSAPVMRRCTCATRCAPTPTSCAVSRGSAFPCASGMNSGEVVVGKIGDDLRMDYTAQGHTVGLAPRMEQLAEPGSLPDGTPPSSSPATSSSPTSASSTSRGRASPLHVYELAGLGALHTRLDLVRRRGFSRFVGRGGSWRCWKRRWAGHSGEGQVVGIVGEAGAGKSRLCHEFTQRCRNRGLQVFTPRRMRTDAPCRSCRCCRFCAPSAGSPSATPSGCAREDRRARRCCSTKRFGEDLPLLFDFLGVPDPRPPGARRMDPEARQRALLELVKRWFSASRESRSQPVVRTCTGSTPAPRFFIGLSTRSRAHATWRS